VIERERRGWVEVVRLAAPPLNLLGSAMVGALEGALREVAGERPRAVVLFCSGAGADVREMAWFDAASARAFITGLHRACAAIREIDAPVIGAIEGPCLGAHLEVAAACDLRIASERSRLGMPEIKVGIPSVIDAYWLALICGLGTASTLVFEGEPISAQEARRVGLVDRVVGDGALDEEALGWAERIARASPVALAQQKRVLRDWTDAAYREAARASVERFVETVEAGEFREAMRAMLEKREPRFDR
jgi:enoyl-CoA hydratase